MVTGTKKRILDEALRLFSLKGYDSVSVEQIAEAVGIKAPSLYKHYKGKRDIFDSIFSMMNEKYNEQLNSIDIHITNGAEDLRYFEGITEELLLKKVLEVVDFSLHDEYGSKFRKLVTTHQFADPEIGKLYTKRYVELVNVYHLKLFEKLIEADVLIPGDVEMMAYQYVSPVYTLLGICEREPEREEECIEKIKRHIHQFNCVYRKKSKEG